jgi:hypothetical protein
LPKLGRRKTTTISMETSNSSSESEGATRPCCRANRDGLDSNCKCSRSSKALAMNAKPAAAAAKKQKQPKHRAHEIAGESAINIVVH